MFPGTTFLYLAGLVLGAACLPSTALASNQTKVIPVTVCEVGSPICPPMTGSLFVFMICFGIFFPIFTLTGYVYNEEIQSECCKE